MDEVDVLNQRPPEIRWMLCDEWQAVACVSQALTSSHLNKLLDTIFFCLSAQEIVRMESCLIWLRNTEYYVTLMPLLCFFV
jgi:hypothetical protein